MHRCTRKEKEFVARLLQDDEWETKEEKQKNTVNFNFALF